MQHTWMMTFLDDFSGYGSIICLEKKSDVETAFRNWLAWAEKSFGNKLLKLHSDHGGEYTSSTLWNFLSKNGIEHQKTVPHTPQQNGRAECFNHMLLDKSEAMQQHACLLPSFWQDVIKTSLHIYNRQPMCHLNWYSPIHLWNDTKLDVSYFRTFGCRVYVFIPKDKQANKLAPKSKDMTFIGYEPGTKGYCFWSKLRRMVVISSTAAFDEFDLPHCPREKLLDKSPPPENQSPEMSNSKDMGHDHNDQGGDDSHQPPDHNQPEILSPSAKSDHGLPDTDTKENDEDLYGLHIHIPARHSLSWMPPHPPNPQGSILTRGARQRSPPAPIVLPQLPIQ